MASACSVWPPRREAHPSQTKSDTIQVLSRVLSLSREKNRASQGRAEIEKLHSIEDSSETYFMLAITSPCHFSLQAIDILAYRVCTRQKEFRWISSSIARAAFLATSNFVKLHITKLLDSDERVSG